MTKSVSILILASFCLAGCGQQIKDFVGSSPSRAPSSTDSSSSSSSALGVKISPGADQVSGTQVKSTFTITPTNQTVSGTQVKSVFAFHRERPTP